MSLHDRFARARWAPMEMREELRCPYCRTPRPFWSNELVCRACAPRDIDRDLAVRVLTIIAALVVIAVLVWRTFG